jgi:hypothetical protein
MKQKTFCLVIIMAAMVPVLQADVLKLKGKAAVQGTLVSANSREIVFLGTDGKTQTYSITDVAGIDFAQLPAVAAPAPAAKPAPAPAAAAKPVMTVPAGTRIAVRLIDSIDGKTAKAGMRYRASIDDPVAIGSQVAIPQSTGCTVEVVSLKTGDEMALRLREVNIGGKAYSTSTADATVDATGTSKKKSAVKRGVGLGAVGAGIGAIAGGGSGAAIGAAVGATVGAVSAAGAKGKQLNVPSETRLLFSLQAPVPLN